MPSSRHEEKRQLNNLFFEFKAVTDAERGCMVQRSSSATRKVPSPFLPQAIEHLRIGRDEMVEHLEYKRFHLQTNSWLLYCLCGIIAFTVSTTTLCVTRLAVLSFAVLPKLCNNGFIFSAVFVELLYSFYHHDQYLHRVSLRGEF